MGAVVEGVMSGPFVSGFSEPNLAKIGKAKIKKV
jgi:hypothetical protein